MSDKPCQKMCPQCPFARSTPKTYLDTMGDNSERFTGQALGPFTLPCHMTRKFKEWRADPLNQTPCVGAATYRTNCSYNHLRGRLPMYPENKVDVFGSEDELLAHHRGISLEEARAHLTRKPPLSMMGEELVRAEVRYFKIPKQ